MSRERELNKPNQPGGEWSNCKRQSQGTTLERHGARHEKLLIITYSVGSTQTDTGYVSHVPLIHVLSGLVVSRCIPASTFNQYKLWCIS